MVEQVDLLLIKTREMPWRSLRSLIKKQDKFSSFYTIGSGLELGGLGGGSRN